MAILSFVPAGSVYATLLQAIDGVMSVLSFVPAGSVYATLLKAIDGVMSLALYPQVVSTPLAPPGNRWCDVLGFVPAAGSVSSCLHL